MSNARRSVIGAAAAAGLLIASYALAVFAADITGPGAAPASDPDNVPRVVGGGSTLGSASGIAVIPYALPQIPADGAAKTPKKTSWGAPDLSGIYGHRARLFQNPAPSTGVGPGIGTAPSALTLHPALATDRLGSRGDYHTPLLRPWAAELVKRLGEAEAAARPYFERCLQNNGVLLTWSRDPAGKGGMQLIQTRERIYMFYGQDVVRVVHVNSEHPENLKPSVNGHSIGRWEGETLVIDTIGFDGTAEADRYGTPSTEQLHIVERMSLRHSNQILEVSFLVDDPLVYTQTWSSVLTFARQEKMGGEYVCRESQMYPTPF
jgi:hypothetical protein